MGHHHGHTHAGHADHSQQASFNKAFIIAILANGLLVLTELLVAVFANSTSLLADAVHNFGDVLGLILAAVGNMLLKRLPNDKATYGMKKTSILAALANGVMLVFTCGIIVSEAIYQLFHANPVHAVSVMIVASVGIVINAATAMLFMRGKKDLNIQAAYLHLLYDAFISLGVVGSAALIYWTGWVWIDPLVGLLIALIILKGTWQLFKDSLRLILDGVPTHISTADVRGYLLAYPSVKQVHDLHIWALSTQENALSVHLLMEKSFTDQARQDLSRELREKFTIHHVTIQVERDLSFCQDACVQ